MKVKLLILFLFFSNLLAAQTTVTGVITDNNNVPLKDVTVTVKSTSITALTDKEGKYSIDVPEGHKSLEFSMKGFVVKMIEISSNEVNLTMTPIEEVDFLELSLEELMNLEVVTAGKKEEKIADIPASVMVLTRRDIELYGFTNLEEIFAHIAGLYYVNNVSFLGPTVGIRGYMTANPTNIVVLVNGVPQQNDLHNSFSFHMIPIAPQAIDRIEVVRGPMSVIYGSNAFFGAINIITNESLQDDKTITNLSYTMGILGNTNAAITSKGKANDFEYSLGFSYFRNEGIDEPFYKMISNFNTKIAGWGIPDTTLTSKKYFTTDQKYIQFSGKFKDLYIETGFAAAKFGQTFGSLFYLPAQCKSYFLKSAIGFRHKFSEKFTINTKVTFSRYDLLMEDNYYSTDPNGFGNESDIFSFGQYWSEKVETELNLFYSPMPNLNISLTGYYAAILDVGDKTDAPFSGAANLLNRSGGVVENDIVNITAFYSQIDYSILDRIKFVLGGRIESLGTFDLVLYRAMYYPAAQKFEGSFTNNEFHFVPRVAIIGSLSKNHVVKLMYGEAIKFPAVWELRNNLTVGQSLDPERIKTYEVNYIGNFSKYLATNISFFRNSIEDVVLRSIIFTGTDYLSYFTNGAKIETNGVEFTLTSLPFRNLKTEISLVYQESENKSLDMEDVIVDFSPNLLGYLKLSYQVNNKLSFSVIGNYVDKMYAQWENTPVTPSDPNSPPKGRYGKAVDAYFLLGANLRYENIAIGKTDEGKGLYFNLKLDNILNTEIHYPSTSVSAWSDKGVLGFGFNAILSAGYKF